ncbi:MAG: tetratricopeptide repeat protein [Phycisphaerae bacterium]|nr:tetratricopeptide repeat protein [Phycisphaerae bacterium]
MKRRMILIVMVVVVLGALVGGGVWYVNYTSASRLLDRAGVAMGARKFDKALDLARQYAEATQDWRGYLLMGQAYNQLGDHEAARAAFAQAEAVSSGSASAEIRVAMMESYTIPARALLSRRNGDRQPAVREAMVLLDRARVVAEDAAGEAKSAVALRSANGLNYVAMGKAELALADALTRQAAADRAAGLNAQADARLTQAQEARDRSREVYRRATNVLLAVLEDEPTHAATATALAETVIELDDSAMLGRAGELLATMAPDRRPPLAWSLIVLRTLPIEQYPVSEPFRSQSLQRLAEVETQLAAPGHARLAGSESALIRRRMGQAYMRLDLPDRALAMFDLSLQADPRDPMSQLLRGQVLLQAGDVDAARKQLYELVSQFGDWADGQFWYAQALLRRGETTLALQSLRRATRADRGHMASRRAIIDILLSQTPPQAQQAYEDARELLELAPGDAGTIDRFIRVVRQLGRPELADAHLAKIRQEHRADPRALWAVVQGLDALHPDQRDQARAVAAEVIATPAKRLEDRVVQARAMQFLGRDAQAETTLRELLEQMPDYAPLVFELGAHHDRMGRYFQAAEFYARAAELDASNKLYGRSLARVLMRVGDVESGMELLTRLRAADADEPAGAEPPREDLTLAMMDAQMALSRQADPLAVVEKLERALPREQAQWLVALAQLRQGRPDDCLAICERALATSPEDTEMLTLSARALADMGRHVEAAAACRKMISYQPDSFAAYGALAKALVAALPASERAGVSGKTLLAAMRSGGREDYLSLAVGGALEGVGNFEGASAVYADVAARVSWPSASRDQARVRQALCLFMMGRHEECFSRLRPLVAGDGELKADATLAYAHLMVRLSRGPEARAEISTLWAAALVREDYSQAAELATMMIAAGAGEAAVADTASLATSQPADVRPLRLQTYLLRLMDRDEEALPVYEQIIELQPGEFQAYLQYVEAQDRCQNPAGALAALDRLSSQGRSGQGQALMARAGLLARWGLTTRAAATYRECEPFFAASPPMLLTIARQYQQLGAAAEARRVLATVPEHSPAWRQAQWQLAIAQESAELRLARMEALSQTQPLTPALLELLMRQELAMGRTRQAVDRYAGSGLSAGALAGGAASTLAVGAMIQLGDWPAACELADALARTGAPWWRQVAATLWAGQGQLDKARALLSTAESATLTEAILGLIAAPDTHRAAYVQRALTAASEATTLAQSQRVSLRVLLHLAAGDVDQAAAELAKLKDAGPAIYEPAAELVASAKSAAATSTSEARALLLASVAMNVRQSALAQRLATDVLRARPACQWAVVLAMHSGDAKSLATLQELYADRDGLLGCRLAAQAATANHDLAAAATALEKALAHTPADAALKIQLAETLQKLGREDRALDLFRQAMASQENSWAANNAAYLVTRLHADNPAKLAEAREWMERTLANHPTEQALYDTAGWVAFLQGDAELACRQLHRAVKTLPQSPDVHYHLGMAYRQAGQATLSRWHLQQAVELGQAMTNIGLPVPTETRESIQLAQNELANSQ